jgi:hypothetical protein
MKWAQTYSLEVTNAWMFSFIIAITSWHWKIPLLHGTNNWGKRNMPGHKCSIYNVTLAQGSVSYPIPSASCLPGH